MGDSRRTTQIRQKIKEILGWDCTMNDEMLVKNYAVTTDGDLIMRVEITFSLAGKYSRPLRMSRSRHSAEETGNFACNPRI